MPVTEWNRVKESLKEIYKKKVRFAQPGDFWPYAEYALKHRDIFLKSAARFGTPQYMLDEAFLAKRVEKFREAFRANQVDVNIFYAVKSNDLPYLLMKLKEHGVNADVSSGLELQLAAKLGFDRIIYTAPIKLDWELELAISTKAVINVDNLDELQRIKEISKGRRASISFRIGPGEKYHRWHKFGLTLTEFKKAVSMISGTNLEWTGVHFHSSWNHTPGGHVMNIRRISSFMEKNFSKRRLSQLKFLDIGGGYPSEGTGDLLCGTRKGVLLGIASRQMHNNNPVLNAVCNEDMSTIEEFAADISSAIKECIEPLMDVEIWAEPGRYISQMPTTILMQIMNVVEKNIYVDAGINLVGAGTHMEEYYPMLNLSSPSENEKALRIFGPLCDPDDHWGYRCFGETFMKGDILALLHSGAYTFSTAWRWQRSTAAYTAFNGKNLKLVKKKETFTQRYAGCRF